MATYTNSPLVNYTKISPNKNTTRVNSKYNPKGVIDKITIHHCAGKLSVESIGVVFNGSNRQASSNYGIGTDGRIGMYVEEKHRAWTSSSPANDYRAVTIEVSNDEIGGNWHVSDKVLNRLVDLCVDICKRNGIKRLNYTGDTSGNLTMHKWFAATGCPGPYLESKFPWIAEQVNKRLNATTNTNTNTNTSSTSKYKAGQAIKLSDTALYSTATTTKSSGTRSGDYYIWSADAINNRIRITNSKSNVGKTGQVTGWVNIADIDKKPSETTTTKPTTTKPTVTVTVKTYKKGDTIVLKNKPLYASSTIKKASSNKSGTYYIYDGQKVNGRYRITNQAKNCDKKPAWLYVTGWVEL